jgi:hypothetical protein
MVNFLPSIDRESITLTTHQPYCDRLNTAVAKVIESYVRKALIWASK